MLLFTNYRRLFCLLCALCALQASFAFFTYPIYHTTNAPATSNPWRDSSISRMQMQTGTAAEQNGVLASVVPAGAATVLSCRGLSKTYAEIPQFRDISLNLGKGQRVGLIGINGAGKSTLLKILAGQDRPDDGSVEVASGAKVIYVDQEPNWGDIPVYEALFRGEAAEARAVQQYYRCLNPGIELDGDEFSRATDAMQEASAWEYQESGVTIAERLSIGADKMYRAFSSLSGGEQRRVGLAAALLLQPQILLLDEPTNHLDIDALDWLADYLRPGGKDRDMAMLLVTHDRFFLERTCSEIIELDRAALYRYPGSYAQYLELKEARLVAEDAETGRARTKLRREAEWMAKQPRARQAKSKARQEQFYELVDRAKGRSPGAKALELSTPEEKERQKRLGGVVAEFRSGGYTLQPGEGEAEGRVLLRDFTYDFRQRDRIGIVGANGVGKSTFLRVLTGELQLMQGSLKLGETVRVGYYVQKGLELTPEQERMPVLKFVQEAVEKGAPSDGGPPKASPTMRASVAEDVGRRKRLAGKEGAVSVELQEGGSGASAVSEREAMALLSRFQFPKQRLYDRVSQLSGGERRRLQLLQVLARAPNVLVLDEPSNDLDLQTLTVLEDYLTEVFEGCLVVVSHDNFFVNRVCEHLFVFEGAGVVRDFQGSYTEYLEHRADTLEEARQTALSEQRRDRAAAAPAPATQTNKKADSSAPAAALAGTVSSPAKSRSYGDLKELGKLEKEMSRLEGQVAEADAQLELAGQSGAGYSVLADLTAKADALRAQLANREEKWLLLNS